MAVAPGQTSGTVKSVLCTFMSKPAIVYQAVNLINGKRYIGITTQSLHSRVSKHFYDARTGRGFCRYFCAAIKKYGEKSFQISVLASVDSFAEAAKMERDLIAELKPEYNITTGGEGTPGHIVTAEVRARISAAHMGREAPNKGIPHTAETKAKIAAKAAGRLWTETRKEDWKATIGKAHSRRLQKPVICLADGRVFSSATQASTHFGLPVSSVANAIGKEGGRRHGMVFAYYDPDIEYVLVPRVEDWRAFSIETRGKISASKKGTPAHNKGVPHTAAVLQKLRERQLGHKMPPQTRIRMKEGRDEYLRAKVMKQTICLTDGLVFQSATEASRHYGWRDCVVSNAIGKTKGNARGRVFQYRVTT